jgi:serine/threonine protein phosphatase PrpC
MRIEAFSEAKSPTDPDSNEDQLLILPGRGCAVIDGVTDRTGHRYDGLLAGQFASRAVQQAVVAFLLDQAEAETDPARLVAQMSRAIRLAYQQHGILEIAREQPPRRFGATLALAAERGELWRFVLVGDSGLRLNGSELWLNENELDLITASLRQEAYRIKPGSAGPARSMVPRKSILTCAPGWTRPPSPRFAPAAWPPPGSDSRRWRRATSSA